MGDANCEYRYKQDQDSTALAHCYLFLSSVSGFAGGLYCAELPRVLMDYALVDRD